MRTTAAKPLTMEYVDFAELAMSLFTLGLDQSSSPLILLTTDGVIKHVVPTAAYMMSRSPILRVRDGRLHLRRVEDRKALFDALNSFVLTGVLRRPAEPSLVVFRNREDRPVMCLLLSRLLSAHFPPFILVRIADLSTPSLAAPDWLVRMFDLTPAEARVGSALLDGLDLRAIAERDGIALETVRGHLKRAMAKTTARSQAQFVRLLLRGYEALAVPSTSDLLAHLNVVPSDALEAVPTYPNAPVGRDANRRQDAIRTR